MRGLKTRQVSLLPNLHLTACFSKQSRKVRAVGSGLSVPRRPETFIKPDCRITCPADRYLPKMPLDNSSSNPPLDKSLQEQINLSYRIVDAINARDWETIRAMTDADVQAEILPRSLGRPILAREDWISSMDRSLAFIPNFKGTVEEVMSVSKDSVCFHVRHTTLPSRSTGKVQKRTFIG
jgi:hypothetical protein